MDNIFKKFKDRKDRHIAEAMQNEINPEEYLRRKRETRKENIVEAVSAILLIPLAYLLIRLWFAYEGFSIQW